MNNRSGVRAAGIVAVFVLGGIVVAGEPSADRLAELKALAKAGKFADAESGARSLLAEVESKSGADSLEAAHVLDVLVKALDLGGKARDPETRKLAERAVTIKEKALGMDSPDVAASLNNLGENLRMTGDYAAARPLYERALAIAEKTPGPDNLNLATSLNNLAILFYQTGDYAAARPLWERALALREKTLGPDHPDLAPALGNLATLLWQTGDYAGARPLYERALAIAQRALGPDHPQVADNLNNLAILLVRTGDYSAAQPLYERALAIREKAYGPDHPRVAESLNNLAVMHYEIGDYATARPLYARALAIYEKTRGPDHPDVADSLNNLASLLVSTGDYVAARPLHERALAIREKALGAEHAAVAQSLDGLAQLAEETGDYAAARPLMERALAIREKALGPEHPEVAQSLSHLADAQTVTGDYAAARPLIERALVIQEKVLGPDHPYVADSLALLANLLSSTGDLPGARAQYERALATYETAFGSDSLYVAWTLRDLARLHEATGDYTAARALRERSVAICEKALGPDHPEVAKSLDGLARLRATQRETAPALDNAIEAERIAREHLKLTGRALSERQALRYAAVRTSGLDLSLTLAARGLDGPSRRRVLDALVRSRAVVLDEMAARHRAVHGAVDPKVASLASALASARARLANLEVRGPGDQPPEIYRKLLDDARTGSEQAERKLAEASAGFARELSRETLGLDEVAASLPAGSALVALAQYRKIDLTPKSPPADKPVKTMDATGDVPSYIAFIVRAGERDPNVVEIGSVENIDGLVTRWKREAAGGAFAAGVTKEQAESAYREVGTSLRKKVWDPLSAALGGVGRAFLVPDGSLNLVNFAALPAEGGGYLVEGGPILHYVSAERDLVPPSEARRGEGLLALGGASYDATSPFASLRPGNGGGVATGKAAASASIATAYRGKRSACGEFASVRFTPLPATDEEAREIVRLWDKYGEIRQVRGPSSPSGAKEAALDLREAGASETALKRSAPGRRVLHLATHGFFLGSECGSAFGSSRGIGGLAALPATTSSDTPAPLRGENPLLLSGLALAGANHRSAAREGEDDGILTAEEIASLDLSDVDWAVLSACETGVGDVRAGEGVFGLRRAFQVAGAGTLILSLWSVEDVSTREWMKSLYEGRLMRKLDTAGAVREASRAVMKRRRDAGESTHPFYWGAFVAAGDWR